MLPEAVLGKAGYPTSRNTTGGVLLSQPDTHYRRYIKEVLKTMVETSRRTDQSAYVILIDLDGFKAVNDEQGHVNGDQVLCDATMALDSALRKSDVLGRHGGG